MLKLRLPVIAVRQITDHFLLPFECVHINSTQLNEHLWTQMLKHLNVHIYQFTSVYQVLQSTWFAYWSVADSGQVGRKIM